jgi:hypothetical protein
MKYPRPKPKQRATITEMIAIQLSSTNCRSLAIIPPVGVPCGCLPIYMPSLLYAALYSIIINKRYIVATGEAMTIVRPIDADPSDHGRYFRSFHVVMFCGQRVRGLLGPMGP